MRIHTLRPAEGAGTPARVPLPLRSVWAAALVPAWARPAARGTRDNGRAAAAEYVPVSRAARCL